MMSSKPNNLEYDYWWKTNSSKLSPMSTCVPCAHPAPGGVYGRVGRPGLKGEKTLFLRKHLKPKPLDEQERTGFRRILGWGPHARGVLFFLRLNTKTSPRTTRMSVCLSSTAPHSHLSSVTALARMWSPVMTWYVGQEVLRGAGTSPCSVCHVPDSSLVLFSGSCRKAPFGMFCSKEESEHLSFGVHLIGPFKTPPLI